MVFTTAQLPSSGTRPSRPTLHRVVEPSGQAVCTERQSVIMPFALMSGKVAPVPLIPAGQAVVGFWHAVTLVGAGTPLRPPFVTATVYTPPAGSQVVPVVGVEHCSSCGAEPGAVGPKNGRVYVPAGQTARVPVKQPSGAAEVNCRAVRNGPHELLACFLRQEVGRPATSSVALLPGAMNIV